jgi:hypothetical protein
MEMCIFAEITIRRQEEKPSFGRRRNHPVKGIRIALSNHIS